MFARLFILSILPVVMAGTAFGQEEPLSADVAEIIVKAPDDAQISVNGKDRGTMRTFVLRNFPSGRSYDYTITAKYTDGETEQQIVTMSGGRREVVRFRSNQPELVLQSGHEHEILNAAFSPDSQYLLTTAKYHEEIILWSTDSLKVLRRYRVGNKARIRAIAFSEAGKHVVAATKTEVLVWDCRSGRQISRFTVADRGTELLFDSAATFFADGSRAVFVESKAVSVWDVADQRLIERHMFPDPVSEPQVACDPAAKTIVVASNGPAHIGFLQSAGTPRQWYTGPEFDSSCLAVSPDGSTIASDSKGYGESSVMWNVKSRSIETQFAAFPQCFSYSPDGKSLALSIIGEEVAGSFGQWTYKLSILDSDQPNVARSLGIGDATSACVAFSPNGLFLFHGNQLYDLTSEGDVRTLSEGPINTGLMHLSGRNVGVRVGERLYANFDIGATTTSIVELESFQGAEQPWDNAQYTMYVVTQDGKQILARRGTRRIVAWSTSTGQKLYAIRGSSRISGFDVDRSGQRVAIAYSKDVVEVWATSTTSRIWKKQTGGTIHAISPDGRTLLTSCDPPQSIGKIAEVWDIDTNTRIQQLRLTSRRGLAYHLFDASFSGDSRRVVFHGKVLDFLASGDDSIREIIPVFDARNGRLIRTFSGRPLPDEIFFCAKPKITGDGNVVVCSGNGATSIWNFDTGKCLKPPSRGRSGAGQVSSDGRFCISNGDGGFIQVEDLVAQRPALRLLPQTSETQEGQLQLNLLAVTPAGLFDGPVTARSSVSFRTGNNLNIVSADRFFQDFYYPGLGEAIWTGARPLPTTDFAATPAPSLEYIRYPQEATTNTPSVELQVAVTDQGGGIKQPWVLHNGARVIVPGETTREDKTLRQTFEVALVEGRNEIEVFSASEDGSWESEPARVVLNYEKPLAKPTLHLVAVGVSEYAEETMNLKFAADDAQSIASMFAGRGPALYGEDNVQITEVSNSEATRTGILDAIEGVAKQAQPQDTFVLFLAGHGTMVGQRYYFLPHDFRNDADRIEDDIRKQGLPGDELNDAIGTVPALKRVMIYDTCQSGGAVALTRTARNPFAFRGALERMSRATGSFIIAATASSADAHEIEDLKHGVLSYTLLAGAGADIVGPLKNQRIAPGEKQTLDVRDWFNYAQDKVPNITKLYLGQEQFVEANVSGNNFPILPFSGTPE